MRLSFDAKQYAVGHGGFFIGNLYVDGVRRGFSYAVDCGSHDTSTIDACLLAVSPPDTKRHFDIVFVTHLDADHVNRLTNLLHDRCTASQIMMPFVDPPSLAINLARRHFGQSGIVRVGTALHELIALVGETDTVEVLPDGDYPGTAVAQSPVLRSGHAIEAVTSTDDANTIMWEIVPWLPPIVRTGIPDFMAELARTAPGTYELLSAQTERLESLAARIARVAEICTRVHIDAIADATRTVKGLRNLNSSTMCIYSGPCSGEDVPKVGWLHTGDAPLRRKGLRGDLIAALGTARPNLVGTLLLAHHGSTDGWHPDLAQAMPNVQTVVSSEGTRYGRPLQTVKDAVASAYSPKPPFHHSTQELGSFRTVATLGDRQR